MSVFKSCFIISLSVWISLHEIQASRSTSSARRGHRGDIVIQDSDPDVPLLHNHLAPNSRPRWTAAEDQKLTCLVYQQLVTQGWVTWRPIVEAFPSRSYGSCYSRYFYSHQRRQHPTITALMGPPMPIVMAPVERESISEAPAPVPLPSFEEWNLEDDDPFRLEDMDTGLDWMGTIPREDPPIPGAQ